MKAETIVDAFNIINTESLKVISSWRLGQRKIMDKINANGVHDVVTEVDISIEELATSICNELLPEIKVFGEENFKHDFSITDQPLYIVIDPIDGTKEFVKGTSDWSISICAVENGIPIISSIFMPDRNEVFTTIKGQGVNLNNRKITNFDSISKSIAVSPRQLSDNLILEKINLTGYVPIEVSALTPKICAILRGDVSSAVYFKQDGQSASLWDYAASVLLIKEFGGKITSLTGSELPFAGSNVIHKDGWLASNDLDAHKKLLLCLNR